jgi:hypothetical protein
MKNTLIYSIMMVVLMGVSKFAMADNGETCKCSNTTAVSTQLSQMMEKAVIANSTIQGAVVVKYNIDANNNIHILDAQSNSDELVKLVKQELEGKSIVMNGSQCTNGYIKVNFIAPSSATKQYVMY